MSLHYSNKLRNIMDQGINFVVALGLTSYWVSIRKFFRVIIIRTTGGTSDLNRPFSGESLSRRRRRSRGGRRSGALVVARRLWQRHNPLLPGKRTARRFIQTHLSPLRSVVYVEQIIDPRHYIVSQAFHHPRIAFEDRVSHILTNHPTNIRIIKSFLKWW